MAYTVLARKYRSRTLAEVVGQAPIVQTLTNAIRGGRVHHGYLFCGTRGVGKTSTARILAKSLNCLAMEAPTVTPCLECAACAAIAEGDDIDVLEIDAASNTGVDNIRQLRENAAYRPARSRFKIYIIDEVHMLSPGAFNALLKTLEEPPEHVKFIMATTELHKVPATIQSRVQRFDFQSIAHEQIVEQLESICSSEGVACPAVVLRRVARAARGSMRDALSLLDQLLSRGVSELDAAAADEILPSNYDAVLAGLIDALATGAAAAALDGVEQYVEAGRTLEQFCENLIEQCRHLMVVRICGADTALVDVNPALVDQLARLTDLDADRLAHMIGVLEGLRRQVKSSNAGRPLVDAAMVRLCRVGDFTAVGAVLDALPAEGPKKKMTQPGASRSVDEARPAPAPVAPRPAVAVTTTEVQGVRTDPLVRRTLEVFEGTLLNVERIAPAESSAAGGPAGAQ